MHLAPLTDEERTFVSSLVAEHIDGFYLKAVDSPIGTAFGRVWKDATGIKNAFVVERDGEIRNFSYNFSNMSEAEYNALKVSFAPLIVNEATND